MIIEMMAHQIQNYAPIEGLIFISKLLKYEYFIKCCGIGDMYKAEGDSSGHWKKGN